ncbi:hypothetical protein TNCV_2722541 [Trichonephila clavipes]|nr:hypothetical protein TNCV_2722541 [Trichonephila clavipes]
MAFSSQRVMKGTHLFWRLSILSFPLTCGHNTLVWKGVSARECHEERPKSIFLESKRQIDLFTLHMIYDVCRIEDLNLDRLMSLKSQWWLGPRQSVTGADPYSFQLEIVGSVREAHPECLKKWIGK